MKGTFLSKKSIAPFLVKLLVVLASLFLLSRLPQLSVSDSLVHTLAAPDSVKKQQKAFEAAFNDTTQAVVVALEARESIWEPGYWEAFQNTLDELAKIEPSVAVQHPLDWRYPLKTPTGLLPARLIHPASPERYLQDSVRLVAFSDWTHTLIGQGHTSAAMRITANWEQKEVILSRLRHVFEKQWPGRYHWVGPPIFEVTFERQLQEEMSLFLVIALVLMAGLLYYFYRTFWAVLLPLVVVSLAITWTMGCIQLLGYSLNALTVLLPTILVVVGISDSVHFLTHYLQAVEQGQMPRKAAQHSLAEMCGPLLLTSLTTAVGFLGLMVVPLPALREFGAFTALGVMFALGFTLLVLPWVLSQLGPGAFGHALASQQPLGHGISRVYRHSCHRPWPYRLVLAILLLGSAWGLTKLQHDRYLLDDLSAKSRLYEDSHFFSRHFGGIRSLEIWLKKTDPLALESYQTLEKMGEMLQNELAEAHLLSAYSAAAMLNQAEGGGYQLPLKEEKAQWSKIRRNLSTALKRMEREGFSLANQNSLRMQLRLPGIGSAKMEGITAKIAAFGKREGVEISVLGRDQLADKSSKAIARQLLWGLLISAVFASVLVAVLFRSFRLMWVGIVPNLLPLVGVAALMGWADIAFSGPIAMVFSIAFGIAVDDSIHFISQYQKQRKDGFNHQKSVVRTIAQSGKAILLSSIFLGVGFGVLLFSGFKGTVYLGLLVSSSIVVAVVIDLLLLPYLLGIGQKK